MEPYTQIQLSAIQNYNWCKSIDIQDLGSLTQRQQKSL